MQTRPFFLVETRLDDEAIGRDAFWKSGTALLYRKSQSSIYGENNVSMVNDAELIEEMIKDGRIKPENIRTD